MKMASTKLDDSTVEWEFIVSRIRYLFIDHTTWPGDPGDPDRWECPATAAPSHLRNPDADSTPDWAHPDLVTQGAVQGLWVPRDQQETGAHRTTQTPFWRPQYFQGHCAVVNIPGFSVNHLFCTFIQSVRYLTKLFPLYLMKVVCYYVSPVLWFHCFGVTLMLLWFRSTVCVAPLYSATPWCLRSVISTWLRMFPSCWTI